MASVEPVQRVAASPIATQATAPAVIQTIVQRVARTAMGDRWAAQVARLQADGLVQALVRELALQAELTAVDSLADAPGEVWRLTVEREPLRAQGLVDKLQAVMRQACGQPALRLEVAAGVAQDSPARREAEQIAQRQAEAERLIHEDPLVQAMLAQFSTARIVSGSIKPV